MNFNQKALYQPIPVMPEPLRESCPVQQKSFTFGSQKPSFPRGPAPFLLPVDWCQSGGYFISRQLRAESGVPRLLLGLCSLPSGVGGVGRARSPCGSCHPEARGRLLHSSSVAQRHVWGTGGARAAGPAFPVSHGLEGPHSAAEDELLGLRGVAAGNVDSCSCGGLRLVTSGCVRGGPGGGWQRRLSRLEASCQRCWAGQGPREHSQQRKLPVCTRVLVPEGSLHHFMLLTRQDRKKT